MNVHVNILKETGHVMSMVDLDSNKAFMPSDPGVRFETRSLTTNKGLYEKIKKSVGMGNLSPVVVEPEAFFDAEFEASEDTIYLMIENDSLKEITQKSE